MKKYCSVAIAAVLAVLIASCNFSMPESITVKTGAKFQVPVGSASYDLNNKFDMTSIRTMIQEKIPEAKVYDYVMKENPDLQSYLIDFSLDKQLENMLKDLNIEEMLNSFDPSTMVGSGLNGQEIPKIPISINAVNKTYDEPIILPDFSSHLHDTIEIINFTTGEFAEGTSAELPESLMPEATVRGGDSDMSYTRIWYSTGALNITFENTGNQYSSDYKLNIKASIYDTNGNLVATSGERQNIAANNIISIPLTNPNGIPSAFKVKFEGDAQGGASSVTHTLKITSGFSNIMPSKIEGVTINDLSKADIDEDMLNKRISIAEILGNAFQDLMSSVKSLKFNDAKLKIKIENPEGWSGISLELPSDTGLVFEGPGIDNVTLTSTSTNDGSLINKEYTLGAKITTAEITSETAIKIQPKITINNATVTLTGGSTRVELENDILFQLKNIEEVILDINSKYPPYESPIALPQELLKTIREINFNEKKSDKNGNATDETLEGFGLKCIVSSNLPAGNDIVLEVKMFEDQDDTSKFYFDKELIIPNNSTDREVSCIDYPHIKLPEGEDGVTKEAPVSVSIKDGNNFKLRNIVLGTNYEINITIDRLVADWDSVKIQLNKSHDNYDNPRELPLNMKEMLSNLNIDQDMLNSISLKTLPVYLYMERSEDLSFLDSIELNGKVYIKYKDGETDKYIDVLGKGTSIPTDSETIRLINTSVPWPEDTSIQIVGNPADKQNVAYYLNDQKASKFIDLGTFISGNLLMMEDPLLYYDIAIGGAPTMIYKSSISNLSNAKLGASIAILLPLEIELKKPLRVNAMDFIKDYNTPDGNGNYSDILQRENETTYETYAEYADMVKEISIGYDFKNELIKGLDLSLRLEDTKGQTGVAKDFNLTSADSSKRLFISLTGEDIKNVLTNYPFHPDAIVQLGRDLTDAEKAAGGKYSTDPGKKVGFYLSRSGIKNPKALALNNVVAAVEMDHDKGFKYDFSGNSENPFNLPSHGFKEQ